MSIVLEDARIEISANLLSAFSNKVEINETVEALRVDAFGKTTAQNKAGTFDWSIAMGFYNSYAASEAHQVLRPIFTARTPVVIKIRLTTAAISTTNPEWFSNSALLTNYQPVRGNKGEIVTLEINWVPGDGDNALQEDTTP